MPSDDLSPVGAGVLETRTSALTAVSSGLGALTCNGGFVYDLDAPNPPDWTRIGNSLDKPAFMVVDDRASTIGTTVPNQSTDTATNAPAFFHNHWDPSMKAVKVLKYIPMNYAQAGDSDTLMGCPTIRDFAIHQNCDNSPINSDCTQVAITTRINNALVSGYDGVFFDEAPTRNDRLDDPQNTPAGLTATNLLGYIDQCAQLVKAADPSKLVIINSGSLPQDAGVFSGHTDIVALENNAVTDAFMNNRLVPFGVAPERWMGLLKIPANPDGGTTDGEPSTETNMNAFRAAGAFWYYETVKYSVLPDWLEPMLSFGDRTSRPQCMGFPTAGKNDGHDGKFIAATGPGLGSVDWPEEQIFLEFLPAETRLDVEVYDGDIGGANDVGSANTCFKLYDAPNGEMTPDPSQLVFSTSTTSPPNPMHPLANNGFGDQTWSVVFSDKMPTNFAAAPSGNRVFRLDVFLADDCNGSAMSIAGVQNRFKVRTNGQISIQTRDFTFNGTSSSVQQPGVVSPNYDYDDTFNFNIDVEMAGNITLTEADADNTRATPPGVAAGANANIGWILFAPDGTIAGRDDTPTGDYASGAQPRTTPIAANQVGSYLWQWHDVLPENAVRLTVQSSPTQYAVYPVPAHRLPTSDAANASQWAAQVVTKAFTPMVLGTNAACPAPGHRTVVSSATAAQSVLNNVSSAYASLEAQVLAAQLNVGKSAGRAVELSDAQIYGRNLTVSTALASAEAALALGPSGSPTATLQELTRELTAVNLGQTTYLPGRIPIPANGAADTDGDGVRDDVDNCVGIANPDQADFNLDRIGDACDPVPQLHCVMKTGGNGFEAFFGYTKGGGDAYLVRNTLNHVTGSNDLPITRFASGGQPIAFTARSTGTPITWTIDTRSVTATASSPQCPGTELTSLPLAQRAVFYAGDYVKIGDRSIIQGCADIVNAGSNTVTVNSGVHTSDVYSVGPVFLSDGSNVGIVRSNGAITLQNPNDTVREGTVPQAGLAVSPLAWSVTFPGGTHNPVSPTPGGPTVSIPPGSYGTVSVPARGTLALASGTYFFDQLTVEPGGILTLASGTIQIYVQSQLIFRGTFNGGTPGHNLVIGYFGTADAILESPITIATFAAPNAHLYIGTGSPQTFLGQFFAKEIELRSSVTAGLPM